MPGLASNLLSTSCFIVIFGESSMSKLWRSGLLLAAFSCWCSYSSAGEIQCEPSDQRVAILSDAVECNTANSINLNTSADLNTLFSVNYTWVKEGELTGAGSNDLFSVTSNGWGTDVDGNWFIDSSFWTLYSTAVITMHVGEGGGNPDAFAWIITPGETSGYFSYHRVDGKGGGLSNLFLFGTGVPEIRVPEANQLLLLFLGLATILLARRRR